MNKTVSLILILLFAGNLFIPLKGQQSAIYSDPDQDLKEGLEMFSLGQYGPAQANLLKYLNRTEGQEATSRTDAAYYHAMCAIYLEQMNGEQLVEQFLIRYPESAKAQVARFEMANILFRDKKYKRALRWFQQIDRRKLNRELQDEYAFKMGYCLFDEGDYKKAQPFFNSIVQSDSDWAEDALYYLSYTHYIQGNYETALRGFRELIQSERYDGLIPYYIAQIYYQQEKYQDVIDFASPLIRQANSEQQVEIARILGDSHFRLGQFNEAIPYLEQYRKGVKSMTREEHYALGFAYYKSRQLANAVGELELVSDQQDPLTQNSNHLLGGILIETGDKYKARSAFRKAANLEFNKRLQEEALFNYAKLSFDLSISGETLSAFEEFLTKFPDSEFTDQVYDYLVKVFMNTRNYKEALATIDKIRDKNADVRAAHQRIAYYRGLELYNNLNYREAIDMFAVSLENSGYNAKIKSLANYWTGEAWYQLKRYADAAKAYHTFLISSGAYNLAEYDLAHYNLGYCYFAQENYDEAMSWFRKFTSRAPTKHERLIADAFNRIGDCYYMNRTYWQAIDFYDKAMALRTPDADYAMFQKGFSFGLVQRPNQKITMLQTLLKDYPKSNYGDDAMYEIGRSYVDINEIYEAIRVFKELITKYSGSSYARKAYIQLGLIYYNQNQNAEALAQYKKVVESWPDTQEARDALAGIKNIYVDDNRVDEYFTYLQSSGRGGEVSVSQQDSLSYIAAVNLYMQGDCQRARQSMIQYISRFPQGSFLLPIHYYKADCDFRSGDYDAALTSYEFVLERGRTEYAEVALSRTAAVYYDRKEYPRAMQLYSDLLTTAEVAANQLDARIGIMRCAFQLKDYRQVVDAAEKVLLTDKIPDEIIREATYAMGKSHLELGDEDNALDVFTLVAEDVKSVQGAEAKYQKARILFKKQRFDEAEKEILEFLDQNTTHQYWLAKTYILWSDLYLTKNDVFQARATLQILKENYKNQQDGILDEVNAKLDRIEKQIQ